MNDLMMRMKQSLETPAHDSFDTDASRPNGSTTASRQGGGLHAELTHAIIGAAIEVHRTIGPGQLESLYQHALERELQLRAIPHRAQAPIAMAYKGVQIGDFVADFIVDDKVIVELKAVHAFEPVHIAQVLSYLRATRLQLGLLINFNVPALKQGVRRLIR